MYLFQLFLLILSIKYALGGFFDNIVNQGGAPGCGNQQCGGSNFLWYFNCCGTNTQQSCCLHVQIWVYFAVIIALVLLICFCCFGTASCICYKLCQCCRREKTTSTKKYKEQKISKSGYSTAKNFNGLSSTTVENGRGGVTPTYVYVNDSPNIDSKKTSHPSTSIHLHPKTSPTYNQQRPSARTKEQTTQTYLSIENRSETHTASPYTKTVAAQRKPSPPFVTLKKSVDV